MKEPWNCATFLAVQPQGHGMGASGIIRFGEFVLDQPRGCIVDATGAERFLRPKSYRVLEVLAERCGQLVCKDDLIGEAWPNVIVTDDSLAHCISDIRRALGPKGAKLLRTVPRRGYMLMADRPSPATKSPPIPRPHLVLTFSLVATIAVLGAGIWKHPRAALNFAQAGAPLALKQADVLLNARDWQRRGDNEAARELLEALLAEDADNADAWASLGLTYWLEVKYLSWGGGRREMTAALDMVERAVSLGGSARAHRLLAEMRLLAPFADLRSPTDALASARASVAINSDDPDNLAVLAHALALTGRAQAAILTIEQARRLNPDPPDWYREVAGLAYLLTGQSARAVEELGPLYGAGTYTGVRWWPGWLFAASLAHAGRIDEATRIVESARLRQPQANLAGVTQTFDGLIVAADQDLVLNGLRLAGLPG